MVDDGFNNTYRFEIISVYRYIYMNMDMFYYSLKMYQTMKGLKE